MDAAVAAIVGAGVGASVTWVGNYFLNRQSHAQALERERRTAALHRQLDALELVSAFLTRLAMGEEPGLAEFQSLLRGFMWLPDDIQDECRQALESPKDVTVLAQAAVALQRYRDSRLLL